MAKVITSCLTLNFNTYKEREDFARDPLFSSQFDFITFKFDDTAKDPFIIEYYDINHDETYGELEENTMGDLG